jgi:hypothetical protein
MGSGASQARLGLEIFSSIVEAQSSRGHGKEQIVADMHQAFTHADSHSTGFISRMQFQTILLDLGCKTHDAHEAEVDDLTGAFDPNKDGQINYSEFVSYFQMQFQQSGVIGCLSPRNDYERVLQQCEHSQVLFEDSAFEADNKSLWGVTLQPPPDQTVFPVWLRPSEFSLVAGSAERPQVLFEDDPTPGDVLEGAIGDCFFIAAVCT